MVWTASAERMLCDGGLQRFHLAERGFGGSATSTAGGTATWGGGIGLYQGASGGSPSWTR